MKWSNGKHSYYGKRNDRGKRARSKIIKGVKNIATIEDFNKLKQEYEPQGEECLHRKAF